MPRSRRDDPGGYKMVLVLRAELRLTPGKAAVQLAHAAVSLTELARERRHDWLDAWVASGAKKIALLAPDLAAIEGLRERALGRRLPVVLIEDAGLTEVPPGTKTCLGIGPAPANEIDAITGELELY